VVNDAYRLARALRLQALSWATEHTYEEVRPNALRVLDVLGKLGATKDVEHARKIVKTIDRAALGNASRPRPQ
jgi:hypothetical protein